MSDLEARASAAVPVGSGSVLVDRYRLEDQVGRGGVADVFAAHDEALHRRVAVKVFRVDGPSVYDHRRINTEIRTLAGLRHPGLVTLFDAVVADERSPGAIPFIVMELVEGPTLRQRIAAGPIVSAEVAELGAELATTLAYVHAQGITHRDVKPANILLDSSASGGASVRAKLTDFGIARLVDSTRITMAGMTVGTANYLSPEQITGEPIGAGSDIYSLGLVLLECLTARVVYPGSDVRAALARVHAQPVVPVSLGASWVRLLTDMVARDPDRRPTATECARQLTGLAVRRHPWPSPSADATSSAATGVPVTGARQGATAVLAANSPVGATRLLPSIPRQLSRRPSTRSRWVAVVGAMLVAAMASVVISAHGSGGGPMPSYPVVGDSPGGAAQSDSATQSAGAAQSDSATQSDSAAQSDSATQSDSAPGSAPVTPSAPTPTVGPGKGGHGKGNGSGGH